MPTFALKTSFLLLVMLWFLNFLCEHLSWVGWGSEQPDVAKAVPSHCRSLSNLSNPNFSMIENAYIHTEYIGRMCMFSQVCKGIYVLQALQRKCDIPPEIFLSINLFILHVREEWNCISKFLSSFFFVSSDLISWCLFHHQNVY